MKKENQKLKLLCLADIFRSESDEEHPLSIARITELLAERGIEAERKTVYSDIGLLCDYGMDIISQREGRATGYYLASREFELPELKLLVDAVYSARFITEKKSDRLIKKLSLLTSSHMAKQLRMPAADREWIKGENESIYYNVDSLYTAIRDGVRIKFRYFEWDSEKKKHYRRDGAGYDASPWTLLGDDEKYNLLAYQSQSREKRHFRVDKMEDISLTSLTREGGELFGGLNVSEYANKLFGMFDGSEDIVNLRVDNSLAGVIIDRFGTEPSFFKADEHSFRVNVRVKISPQFYAWVFSFGGKVKLEGPEYAAAEYRAMAAAAAAE